MLLTASRIHPVKLRACRASAPLLLRSHRALSISSVPGASRKEEGALQDGAACTAGLPAQPRSCSGGSCARILGSPRAQRGRSGHRGAALGTPRGAAPGTERPLRAQRGRSRHTGPAPGTRAGPERRTALPARAARPVPALPGRDAVQSSLLQPAVPAVQPHHHLVPFRPAPPRHHRPQRFQPPAGRGGSGPGAGAGCARSGRRHCRLRLHFLRLRCSPRPPAPLPLPLPLPAARPRVWPLRAECPGVPAGVRPLKGSLSWCSRPGAAPQGSLSRCSCQGCRGVRSLCRTGPFSPCAAAGS